MREGFHLSTRLAISIALLVMITAVSVGYLGYRNIAAVAVERTLVGLNASARGQANGLGNLIHRASVDVKSFRRFVGIDELIALSRNPALTSAGGQTAQQWRARVGEHMAAAFTANPDFVTYRLISADGREIVRVERGENGSVRIVPDDRLRRDLDQGLKEPSVEAAPGQIVVSPAELERDSSGRFNPDRPVIRVMTPVAASDDTIFGLLIATIDLRRPFEKLVDLVHKSTFDVVNDRGDYLFHPDRQREFGFLSGTSVRLQDEFPALARAVRDRRWDPAMLEDRSGNRFGVALQPVQIAGFAPMTVVEMVAAPNMVSGPALAWLHSTLLGGGMAVLIAVLLAIVFARTLTEPLSQMSKAVAGFNNGAPINLPLDASGEIGLLARAFKTMVRASRTKTSALLREKEIFESIMNTMAESVLLLDANGEVVYENAALAALRRPPSGEPLIPWEQAFDVFLPDGATPLPQHMRPGYRALRGEPVDRFEMAVRVRQTGRVIDVLGSARPIRGEDGRINGAVAVFNDITEIKEAQRRLHQAQKLEAIGQLTGGVAHDFDNVLTVISGTAEILLAELADRPHLVRIAQLIDQAAERGVDLTRQLLAFARKQPLQPRSVDINSVIGDIQQLLCSALGAQIETELRLGQDVDPAHVDPSQLSSALLNLAVNARDAMPHGGKLRLETTNATFDRSDADLDSDLRPGHYVVIAATDTGTGIPAHMIDKVFEPFFTTKGAGKGTGLGLSMVYGFVKQSGGHVRITSEEGRGTTIELLLPRAEVEADEIAAEASAEGGSEAILLVEDDALVRSFAVAQLQGLGYRVIAVADGIAALAEVNRSTPFDLLLTDMVMPGGINGRELADAVARLRPVRVLLTSGYSNHTVDPARQHDRGVLLLSKPYRRSELARLVRAALEGGVHVPDDEVAL